MYVVQAVKAAQADEVDPENPEESISSKMWMIPTLESRDKKLVTPRIARAYLKAHDEETKDALVGKVVLLPKVYEALIKMDQFAFNFLSQSQLATDLILDPDFDANDEQIKSLKQGELISFLL